MLVNWMSTIIFLLAFFILCCTHWDMPRYLHERPINVGSWLLMNELWRHTVLRKVVQSVTLRWCADLLFLVLFADSTLESLTPSPHWFYTLYFSTGRNQNSGFASYLSLACELGGLILQIQALVANCPKCWSKLFSDQTFPLWLACENHMVTDRTWDNGVAKRNCQIVIEYETE